MKLRLAKRAEKIIGAQRVSSEVYAKLMVIANREGVTIQEVVRAILDQVIDTIEV